MQRRKLSPFYSYLVAFSLLWQALIPFAANYQWPQSPAQREAAESSALFGDKILICTGEGFRWISLKDVATGKASHTSDSHYQCPLCYVAAHGTSLAPAQVTLDASTKIPLTLRLPQYEYLADSGERRWSRLRTRAPPAEIFLFS